MNDNELKNMKFPYLDPLPKYSWWDVAGGVMVLVAVGMIAYITLWC